VDVVSALDMLDAVQRHLPQHDALVMCAAVADWRPKLTSTTKLKKSAMSAVLELAPNPDILETLRSLKGTRLFVGFAAETGDPTAEALRKLTAKGLDLIVANDVTQSDAGFAVDTNRVTLISATEPKSALPLQSKLDVGREIVAWLERHSSPA
jgi:phosphopantothenoylcysteine decarboxylase/phosphopantothenate--cysteine ligase